MIDEADKLNIMNAALTAFSDSPRGSLGSGGANITPLERNYENIAEMALTSGPEWRFATRTEAPSLIGERSDDLPYDYEWSLPNDSLEVRKVMVDQVDWEVWDIESDGEKKILLIDHDTDVLVRHIVRAGESTWHPSFRMGVQKMLEAVLARAFWEDENAARALEQDARGFFSLASARQGHRRSFESQSVRRRRHGRPPA
ncbi:MAG: hypothetical protein ACLFV8_11930 [Alphaproteobacteria bacterium]